MKVTLLGSTGLVGSNCLKFLANNVEIDEIVAPVRKKTDTNLLKVKEVIFDFDNADNQQEVISGEVLICCLGTTIKKAKTKETFKKVDLEYPIKLAHIAFKNGIKHCIIISSVGANSSSSFFYLKTKGEMEDAIKQIPFHSISFIRPSMLLGSREEFRLGEKITAIFIKLIKPFLFGKLSKFKGVEAETIAIAINNLIRAPHNTIKIIEFNAIKAIANL